MTNKPTLYWAPGTALAKLENRHNNSACILTDTQAERNDVALMRLTDHEAERAADKARIAELEAALAPFAHAADRFMPRNRKLADARRDQATIWSACDGKYAITVQDLRTADAALAQQGTEVRQ